MVTIGKVFVIQSCTDLELTSKKDMRIIDCYRFVQLRGLWSGEQAFNELESRSIFYVSVSVLADEGDRRENASTSPSRVPIRTIQSKQKSFFQESQSTSKLFPSENSAGGVTRSASLCPSLH